MRYKISALLCHDMCVKSIARVVCGFLAQYLGMFVSVNVFASPDGIFWWTGSAITIAAMTLTPERWKPERVVHVVSGAAAYVCFRYENFPAKLLAAVCVSNALGQVFGYATLKRFYPDALTKTDVRTHRFLAIFFLFPVVLASLVASIPGTVGFHLYGNDVDVSAVIVNYTLGHVSGTAALLYPMLIVPTLWRTTKWSKRAYTVAFTILPFVTGMCGFSNYHRLGFATILGVYGVFIAISGYMDQCQSSLVQLACTCSLLGLTAAGRGPFFYVRRCGSDAREFLIGTHMGIAALVAMSAFVSISISQLRVLQHSHRESCLRMEKLAENQTIDLFRIGHDMRNNSTLVQAVCEMEDSDVSSGDKVQIVQAINVLNDVLVCDMVEMVNGKKEDRLVLREDVHVVEVMQIYFMIAKGLLLMEGKDKSVVIQNNFSGKEEYVVHTNRERLHQVIANLVSNAVKYTEEGEINLWVRSTSDSNLKIDVKDSGIGMNHAEVASVFDLFFRSKRASKVNSGAGVGLFNVQKLCEAIDAQIEVSSLGEGKGSTFTLVLPRKMHTDDEGERGVRVCADVFCLCVLVMDDSPVIRRLMSRYLVSFGCEVVEAASAKDARSLLSVEKKKIDVVITDSSMGVGETGPEFIRSARKGLVKGLVSQTPCIICSGNQFYNNGTETDTCTIAITKPFSSSDIASALTKLGLASDGAGTSGDVKV